MVIQKTRRARKSSRRDFRKRTKRKSRRREKKKKTKRNRSTKMRTKQICIVTNNCYGTKYYHKNKLQYNSPFIGLFIYSECFIQLLENFNQYMSIKPQACLKSKYGDKKYPVMKIKDIEVHCIHDKDVKESIEKWERRKKRMFSLSKCYIKMCDHDRYEDEYGKRFIKLRFKKKKLFLSKKNYFRDKCVVKTKYKNRCPDGYALGKDYPIQRYLLKG